MSDEIQPKGEAQLSEDRRAFLVRARDVAVVAPAAALLLSATASKAQVISGAVPS